MGTVASKTIALSEFANLPDLGVQHEVNAGELLTLPPPKSLHSRIARLVAMAIEKALTDDSFQVFVEAGYLLCLDPLTIRQPDISVLSKQRIAAASANSYFEGAPELAIEIVSPSDSADEIETKVRQYLNHGSFQVWVLYPKTQSVHIFNANSSAAILAASQTLEGIPVLPGLAVPVASFFSL